MPSNLQIYSLNKPKPKFTNPTESTIINKKLIPLEKNSQSNRSEISAINYRIEDRINNPKPLSPSNLQIFSLNKPKPIFTNPTDSTFINKKFIPLEKNSQSDRSKNSAINDRIENAINNPKPLRPSNLQIFSSNKPKPKFTNPYESIHLYKEFLPPEENAQSYELETSMINDRSEDVINNPKPLRPSNLQIYSSNKPKHKFPNPNESIPLYKEFLPLEENPQSDRLHVFAQWLDLSVYDRNNLWAQNKTKRIELQKTAKKKSTMQGCTFQPKTSNNLGVSPEKYGSFDITNMKKVFKEEKNKVFNSYSSQRTLKQHYTTVNKPLNYPIN